MEYVDKSSEAGADPEHLCANWERGCNGTTGGSLNGFLDLCDNCRLGIRSEKRAPKHTPGPWAHVWREDRGNFRIGPDDGKTMPVASTVNQGDRENEEANARLIAAAPELLASLSEIVRKSHLRPGRHEDCHVHPDLIARARAVLASIQQSA